MITEEAAERGRFLVSIPVCCAEWVVTLSPFFVLKKSLLGPQQLALAMGTKACSSPLGPFLLAESPT